MTESKVWFLNQNKKAFPGLQTHLSSASQSLTRAVQLPVRVVSGRTGRTVSCPIRTGFELMLQISVLCAVPLCRVLLTRPNASKPQPSYFGLLTWYGVAISNLLGLLTSTFVCWFRFLVTCLVY